jgi:hypothetical protein
MCVCVCVCDVGCTLGPGAYEEFANLHVRIDLNTIATCHFDVFASRNCLSTLRIF